MRTRISIALAAVGLSALMLTTGCSFEESICGSGEYPAIAVGAQGGSACFPNGQEPTPPYVRYPEGKEPRHVDDEWDVYWRTHGIDENNNIVER
ncbi:hypothetical protein O7598_00325 [Micromonospora sp. WMMC241]|uniref:SCO0607 family lipoprotein n=1 Tax=Micromonospora sp. WMMC241 TaxID=3015159 RepID=UPI0022B662F6|nr:hypothetical protein [Micromonospora sp. WMMC241]MCZ7434834.1 hypothetical protein [Micromonospora sp. WMMC241]